MAPNTSGKKRKFDFVFIYYAAFIVLLIISKPSILKWSGYTVLVILLFLVFLLVPSIMIQPFRTRLQKLIVNRRYDEARKYTQGEFKKKDEASQNQFKYVMTVITCHELLESTPNPELIHKTIQDINTNLNDLESKNDLMELSYSFILAALYLKLYEHNKCNNELKEFDSIVEQFDGIRPGGECSVVSRILCTFHRDTSWGWPDLLIHPLIIPKPAGDCLSRARSGEASLDRQPFAGYSSPKG